MDRTFRNIRTVALLLLFASQATAADFAVRIDDRLPAERVWASLRAWEDVADVHWFESHDPGALHICLGTIDAVRLGFPLHSGAYGGLYEPRTNTITLVNPEPFIVSQTVMHEVGHFLGLWNSVPNSPHCADRQCLMNAVVGYQRKVCRSCVAQVIRRYGPAKHDAPAEIMFAARPAGKHTAAAEQSRPFHPTHLLQCGDGLLLDQWIEVEIVSRSAEELWSGIVRNRSGYRIPANLYWLRPIAKPSQPRCRCGTDCPCKACDCSGCGTRVKPLTVKPFGDRPTVLVQAGDVLLECEVLGRSTQWHFQVRTEDGRVFWVPRHQTQPAR